MIDRIHPLLTNIEPPSQLNSPFCYEPHPLCLLAADEVKAYVQANTDLLADAEKGEMFGVLVVEIPHGDDGETGVGFLAAYAGLLAGRNDWDWFVPPVFDAQKPDGHFKQTEAKISALNREIENLAPKDGEGAPSAEDSKRIKALKQQRKEMSNDLLLWLFDQYNFVNYKGEVRNVVDVWRDYHNSPQLLRKFPLPPGGTGECCAPKLFHYAYQNGLKPLAVAEFWWGASPKREIRHHFQFYPACNGKCKPVLTWMLSSDTFARDRVGEALTTGNATAREANPYVQTLYVDDQIAVVVKPGGLLSVPGNTGEISLYDIMRQRFPQATGPMMVHRLDQATSGVMVVAKTEFAYKQLQRQFEQRETGKRYVAIIEKGRSADCRLRVGDKGVITLPLAPDYLDRPRQIVDEETGKPAVTDYEIVGEEGPYLRVVLTPHTGRTHQLRVHCAHQDGLGCPIVGDELYGFRSDRLYLHAEMLSFVHPLTGERMEFTKEAEF